MEQQEHQKLNLLKKAFNHFMEIPFPHCIDEMNQKKDPHGALLYLDEDIAVAVLSWLNPNFENKNHFHKKKDLTEEIKHTKKIIKNYRPKNQQEEEIIETMFIYLNEIIKLHNAYLALWK